MILEFNPEADGDTQAKVLGTLAGFVITLTVGGDSYDVQVVDANNGRPGGELTVVDVDDDGEVIDPDNTWSVDIDDIDGIYVW